MRLIDLSVLLELVKKSASCIYGILAPIAMLCPTIEAEPVVRCKDCRHRYDVEHCPMCQEHDYRDEDGDCDYYTVDRTTDNGFCDRGERWEENADD